MNIKNRETYSEVYQILNLLGNEYINKLPNKLFDMLKEKRDINYNPEYKDDIPLYKQNIKKDTISIIAILHLNYWCENENEKDEIRQILRENEEKYQSELKIKYNPDDIFSRHKKDSNIETIEQVAMVEYKESIFKKIINKIKRFFY